MGLTVSYGAMLHPWLTLSNSLLRPLPASLDPVVSHAATSHTLDPRPPVMAKVHRQNTNYCGTMDAVCF